MDVETGTDTVRAWVDSGVGVIELNRPERRNALHAEMFDAIPALVERFGSDDEVGCILLTAAGPAFCAGGDVKGGRGPARDASLADDARMVLHLHECPTLSIAALPGPAAGAGVGIALSTDLRIAARSASLVTAYANLGFSGDFASTWFLTRYLGPGRALDLLVSGGRLEADEALRLGIFNRVVADDDLRDEAMAWAKELAAGPRTAWRLMKENVHDALRLDLREHLPVESDRMVQSGQTDDHRQAVKRWLADAEAKRGKK